MKGSGLSISPSYGWRAWTAEGLLQRRVDYLSPHLLLPSSGHCFHALPHNLACRINRHTKHSPRGQRSILPLAYGHPERMLTRDGGRSSPS